MKKLVPDPHSFTLQYDAAQCDSQSLDHAATDRALNYYLQDHKPTRHMDTATYSINDSVNFGAALGQASDLLCCAGASVSEAGHGLSGQPYDLMMPVMHLVELTKTFVDKSLDGLTTH